MPKKFYVSWDNLQREARRLARRQLPVSQWKGIIAVSRGGLVPAALMARELGIRNVETLCISSYDHNSQRELVVVKAATTAGDGEGWLVVDDLVDTGGTAKAIRDLYPKAKFITIFAKPMGEPLVDDFEVAIPQDTWIEQPWDMALEFANRSATKSNRPQPWRPAPDFGGGGLLALMARWFHRAPVWGLMRL